MSTRMIERWFPCAEVSEHSARGWGSGSAEKSLFTWFASRPLAQAKAAVICSLLPWPDDLAEQVDLKNLVRKAMTGYDAANSELRSELEKHYPTGAKLCDPFSGRAMIPLEAARLGVKAWGIDYSPVAALAGRLLAEYPMRNWDNEPTLPFDGYEEQAHKHFTEPRLWRDVQFVLDEVGRRYEAAMGAYYPKVGGKRPWGYIWAITLPCTNCGNRFPLTGNLNLRKPKPETSRRPEDRGQSYKIVVDITTGDFRVEVIDGPPTSQPTLTANPGKRGKSGMCCFCGHAHPLETLKRLMRDGLKKDVLLVVADHGISIGKHYRLPTVAEIEAAHMATSALDTEPAFGACLPAVPTERLDPNLSGLIGPAGYGYREWGELCNDRQTLGFVCLVRIIDQMGHELRGIGASDDYAEAIASYAASNFVRILKFGTRSATLFVQKQHVGHIYFNDSGISHSFDYFETGCGDGPGTWRSVAKNTVRSLTKQLGRVDGMPAEISRGSAMNLSLPDGCLDAVVTDPPYDAMINYCDSSDLMYVWLKRAMATADPFFSVTTDANGLQEKSDEAVIKRGLSEGDHRTETHYKASITKAFEQARIKTKPDGVVSIVFGHGDPDAWERVLTAIADAGLVLTGSWPCSTEKGGKQTGEHIDNTIMMACRAAASDRPAGDVRVVDQEVRAEIAQRVPVWTDDGLADSDQRMAAIAPAMEVVGRYSDVCDFTGDSVPISYFLGLAYKAVEEAANVRIDKFRLTDFDDRTRFALAWARQHGRCVAAGSESRWQRLSYDLSDSEVQGIIVKAKGGTRLAFGREAAGSVDLEPTSPVIDIALAVACADRSIADIAEALHLIQREHDDMLWAAIAALSRYVGESDEDGLQWAWAVRNRQEICGRARHMRSEHERHLVEAAAREAHLTLFE